MNSKKDDCFTFADLSICDVATIRMALKDSVELAIIIHEKFVSQKRSSKMINQAKSNIDHAKEKLNYFEKKLHYQSEWVEKYLTIYNGSNSSDEGKSWFVEWF